MKDKIPNLLLKHLSCRTNNSKNETDGKVSFFPETL